MSSPTPPKVNLVNFFTLKLKVDTGATAATVDAANAAVAAANNIKVNFVSKLVNAYTKKALDTAAEAAATTTTTTPDPTAATTPTTPTAKTIYDSIVNAIVTGTDVVTIGQKVADVVATTGVVVDRAATGPVEPSENVATHVVMLPTVDKADVLAPLVEKIPDDFIQNVKNVLNKGDNTLHGGKKSKKQRKNKANKRKSVRH
jgi:hypothetical protein